MRKKLAIGVFAFLVLVVGATGWVTGRNKVRLQQVYDVPLPDMIAAESADLALGERIVRVRNGCVDCHGDDLAGKVFVEDPALGVIAGSNLTPFNLQSWSDAEIARAIHNGLHKSGRALLVMPSGEYNSLSKGDVLAVIAYLRSLPPIGKPNHESALGPVGQMLMGLGIAQFLPAERIDHTAPFKEKPREEASVAFGQYLAHTACIGCHGASLGGGPIAGGDPSWPPASDLTQRALAGWTEEDFARVMKTGVSKNGQTLRPPMPVQLTSQMSELEVKALWMFLRTISAPATTKGAH